MKNQSNIQSTILREHEIEILEYITSGFRFKYIATHYGLPIRAVRAYLRVIFKKLGVRSVKDAVNKIYSASLFQNPCHIIM